MSDSSTTSEFRTRRRVEFADTDCAGIAHFSVFFRYMEEAEHAFLRSAGLSVRTPCENGNFIGFPRLSTRCEFLKSVTFEDCVDIELWVSRIGGKTIEYSCEFSHDGTPIARAQVVVIACLVHEGRSSIEAISVPDIFREKLRVADRPPPSFRERDGSAGDAR